jgi:hypothetical protein
VSLANDEPEGKEEDEGEEGEEGYGAMDSVVCKQGLEGGATCCLSSGPLECSPPEPAHMAEHSSAD